MAVLRRDPMGPVSSVWDQAQQAANAPEPSTFGTTRPGRQAAVNPALTGYGPANDPANDVPSMPNVDDDYITKFRASLASSRADVQRQYDAALADINASEGRASAAVQQLPGMLQGIYGPAAAQIDQDVAASKAAQAATGLQSFTAPGAGVEPMRAAITSNEATRKADVPLLALGVGQTFAGQRGGLQQARLAAESDLTQREQDAIMQQGQQQKEWEHQLLLAQMQDEMQARRDRRQHRYDMENTRLQLGVRDNGEKAKAKQEARAVLGSYGPQDATAKRAMAIRQYDPQTYARLARKARGLWTQSGEITKAEEPSAGGLFTPGGIIREGWRAAGGTRRHLSHDERMKAISGIGPRTRAVLNLLYGK